MTTKRKRSTKLQTMRQSSNNSSSALNNLSSNWVFQVGSRVHSGSWGKRDSTRRAINKNDKTNKQPQWASRDFSIGKMIGAGHFGKIYRASYVPRDGKYDAEEEAIEAESYPIKTHGTVAIKCFAKSKLLSSRSKGGRALQLLRREVNIQSQYVSKI